MQPNKHTQTWQTLAKTIFQNWNSVSGLLEYVHFNFLQLRETVQKTHKKQFPYLSGPKIFNYWSYIIQKYGKVSLKNSEFIDIAPDTHVTQSSVQLGVISKEEADTLSKEKISEIWRNLLSGTKINPIDLHEPLWLWSRNNFEFKL